MSEEWHWAGRLSHVGQRVPPVWQARDEIFLTLRRGLSSFLCDVYFCPFQLLGRTRQAGRPALHRIFEEKRMSAF